MKSIDTDKTSVKIAEILLRIGSVILRPKQPFRFDSGIISPIYVDNRCLITFPKERKFIVKEFLKIIKKIGNQDVIAGLATAGIPYAAWIAEELALPMIYIRSKPKDHGKKNQIEGVLKKGQKVLIIEDLISTAGTSVRAVEAIRKSGGIVKNELAIYSHNLNESTINLTKAKVKLHYLTGTKKIVEVAKQQKILSQDQISMVLSWSKDPKNWGKKMGFE